MQRDIKLVICDIDWTLVCRKNRFLSDFTKNVFETMHKNGVYFGIGSGRPIDEVTPTYDSWKLSFKSDVIIGLNGVQIWDEHSQKLYENYKLKKEWIREIVEMTKPLNVNPYMYYHGGFLAMKDDENMHLTAERNHKPLYIAKDIDEFASEDNAKILMRIQANQMNEFESYIKKFPSPYYKEFKTQETLMEFTNSKISKGVALIDYCKQANIPLEKVIAFGDTTNDNSMLKNAGIGVCLLNGSDDTKAIADAITDYPVENDGVAHYLNDHIYNYF